MNFYLVFDSMILCSGSRSLPSFILYFSIFLVLSLSARTFCSCCSWFRCLLHGLVARLYPTPQERRLVPLISALVGQDMITSGPGGRWGGARATFGKLLSSFFFHFCFWPPTILKDNSRVPSVSSGVSHGFLLPSHFLGISRLGRGSQWPRQTCPLPGWPQPHT